MRRKGPTVAVLAAIVLMQAGPEAWSDAASARREDQLKAAYLLNFVKFVEWPAAVASESLTLCFLGAPSVYEALAAGLQDKRVGTRSLSAREIRGGEVDGCHVLYIDASQSQELPFALQEPRAGILTVSDAREFARHGGAIELFTDSNRLRFIINMDNARRAGLRIGSGLLQLATVIDREGRK